MAIAVVAVLAILLALTFSSPEVAMILSTNPIAFCVVMSPAADATRPAAKALRYSGLFLFSLSCVQLAVRAKALVRFVVLVRSIVLVVLYT